MFQGNCNLCGQYGHTARYCPKGTGKGIKGGKSGKAGKGIHQIDENHDCDHEYGGSAQDNQEVNLGGITDWWKDAADGGVRSVQLGGAKKDNGGVGSICTVQARRKTNWCTKVPGGHKVKAVLDTGAITTVHPKEGIPGIETTENEHTGSRFAAANGSEMENVGQISFKATDYKTGKTKTTLKSQGTDVSDFLLAGLDVVECDGNWMVLNKRGGYVWNEVTNKTIEIERNGRRFELELFVPDDQSDSTGWSKSKRTVPHKRSQKNDWQPTVHNRFDELSRREGEWNLGFLGQAKP